MGVAVAIVPYELRHGGTPQRLEKGVPPVTVVRRGAVVLSTSAEFLALDFTAAWGLDSGPPARPPARASFTILRI